jgi:glycosyltransferase involved in cell wall biosynthesis
MDYKNTKISVIIPTVNAFEEIDLAIASIKKNSDCQIEFVIVIDPDMNTGVIIILNLQET